MVTIKMVQRGHKKGEGCIIITTPALVDKMSKTQSRKKLINLTSTMLTTAPKIMARQCVINFRRGNGPIGAMLFLEC